jgi:serine/threonine-protein kinase
MTVLAGYELLAPLGRGAMGTVYRARSLAWAGREVAIKRVPMASDPALTAHLRAEADVLASLDHPHIVRILELLPDGDGVALAMQLATGGSLADRLMAGPMPAALVADMAAKVADALACAHRQGVLHCDVKPGNILFTADGEPLLSDFGLARWVARASVWGGAVLGTAEYLDPAVAEGAEPDARSDVYALAVVCFEALTGRAPYTGHTPLATLRAADRARPEPMTGLPEALAAVVLTGMARRPEHRYPSAEALAAALRHGAELPPRVSLDLTEILTPTTPELGERTGACAPVLSPGSDAAAFPATRDFGPRPPRPVAAAAPTRAPRVRAAVAIAAAVVVLVGCLIAWQQLSGRAPVGGAACPVAPPPAVPADGELLWADVAGSGCQLPVLRTGAVTEVAGVRYEFGLPSDRLLLGDWDGDGRDTPALYRPDSGTLHTFSAWARPGNDVQAEVRTIGRGAPVVIPAGGRGGADRIELRAARSVEASVRPAV